MPVMIPIQVQVPPTYVLRLEEFQTQLTEYAQSLIDAAVDSSQKVYSADELATHTCSAEELRDNLLQRVHAHFHPELV